MVEPVSAEVLRAWPLPAPGGDKEARGRAVVVGGSDETPGAVRLAGEAALRAGGGKLQLATTSGVATALGVAVPESLVIALATSSAGHIATSAADEIVSVVSGAGCVLLGPGLADLDATVALMEAVIPRLRGEPAVLVDALASGYVTEHPDGLRHLSGRCVLTVNPTELSRTLGVEKEEVSADQAAATQQLADRTGVVVLCGGGDKTIATPNGRCWLVTPGGPGLGVSGSGDVQAGFVTGLLARGAEPAQAAVWGAWLHGSAGERLAARQGTVGFLARELAAEAPRLLEDLG